MPGSHNRKPLENGGVYLPKTQEVSYAKRTENLELGQLLLAAEQGWSLQGMAHHSVA